MIQYKFLIVCVDGLADDAEQSEDLKVFPFMVMCSFSFSDIVTSEILDDLSIDEVINKEKIIPKELLK